MEQQQPDGPSVRTASNIQRGQKVPASVREEPSSGASKLSCRDTERGARTRREERAAEKPPELGQSGSAVRGADPRSVWLPEAALLPPLIND